MTTDTPLMLFWAAALWCVWMATEGGKRRLWPVAGVFLGLGMLSKYTMAFLIPSVAIYLALSPAHRHWLRRPHPYIAVTAGLVLMSPVLWWNWSHNWVSFRHVASDAGVDRGWQLVPGEFVKFLGSQLGVISPVMFALLVAVAVRILWRRRRAPLTESERFLLCMTLPVFLAYSAKALQDKVQGNWTALCFYPWVLLAAGHLDAWARAREAIGRPWLPRVLAAAALAPAFAITWFLMEPLSFGGVTMRFQPAVRHGDWRALARAVDEERAQMPRPEQTFVVAREYQTAALLAFYMDGQPQVFLAPDTKRRMSQYDFWPSYEALGGWDALYVRRGAKPTGTPLVADHFTSCATGRLVDIALPGTEKRPYTIYPCFGFDPSRFVRAVPLRY
jgi:undecaprenyl-diphosphatase